MIMSINPLKIAFALLATLCSLAAGTALAQANRTWVSGVGDDVNPCSRTAPCKTFAGAISKTAAGGEIDVLDPGGFGALTITKAITIDGSGGSVAGVLVSGTNGIVIQAGPGDVVTLRNLDINGIGSGLNGIRFLSGAGLEMHNVDIYGFTQQGIDFQALAGTSPFLTVTNSRLLNNAGGAVLMTGPGTGTGHLTRVQMAHGQRGLRVEDGQTAHVTDSVASSNTGNGFIAIGTSRLTVLTLERSAAFGNGAAGVFAGSFANVFVTGNAITGNGIGLAPIGGSIISSGDNTVQGNGSNGAPTLSPGRV